MPVVEITGPAFPQDAKDRLAKKITEIIAEEEKKAIKLDTTAITVVLFREVGVPDLYYWNQTSRQGLRDSSQSIA